MQQHNDEKRAATLVDMIGQNKARLPQSGLWKCKCLQREGRLMIYAVLVIHRLYPARCVPLRIARGRLYALLIYPAAAWFIVSFFGGPRRFYIKLRLILDSRSQSVQNFRLHGYLAESGRWTQQW
jgi:hypothetical protein